MGGVGVVAPDPGEGLGLVGLGFDAEAGAGQAEAVETGDELVGQGLGGEGGDVDPVGRGVELGRHPEVGRGAADAPGMLVEAAGQAGGAGPSGPKRVARSAAGRAARSPRVRRPRRTRRSARSGRSRVATGCGARKARLPPGGTMAWWRAARPAAKVPSAIPTRQPPRPRPLWSRSRPPSGRRGGWYAPVAVGPDRPGTTLAVPRTPPAHWGTTLGVDGRVDGGGHGDGQGRLAAVVAGGAAGREGALARLEDLHPGGELLDRGQHRLEGAGVAGRVVGQQLQLRAAALGLAPAQAGPDSLGPGGLGAGDDAVGVDDGGQAVRRRPGGHDRPVGAPDHHHAGHRRSPRIGER